MRSYSTRTACFRSNGFRHSKNHIIQNFNTEYQFLDILLISRSKTEDGSRCQYLVALSDLRGARLLGEYVEISTSADDPWPLPSGEPKRALRLMYRYIDQVKSLVVKPNRDLTLCQDAARLCLASLGSMYCIRGGRS